MRPATESIPKALIPVRGRPFAELQLEWLRDEGVQDIIYCIGYRGDMVRAALGDGSRFDLRLRYVDEGEHLRGTAGALRLAFDQRALPDAFFVLNGDSYLQVHLTAVEDAWKACGKPVLMTVFHNMNRWDRSNVTLANGLVRYKKRRSSEDDFAEWIDYGLSVLTRDTVEKDVPTQGAADLAELMSTLSQQGLVAGYEVESRFYEIGSREGLRELGDHLAKLN